MNDSPAAEQPLLRVVRGNPTPPELAALVLVLSARARQPEPASRPPSRWADPAYRLRQPPRLGVGRAVGRSLP